jgi:secreted trypsin-like serine protease
MLVGIASFGSAKCKGPLPAGLFTNVGAIRAWVQHSIRHVLK